MKKGILTTLMLCCAAWSVSHAGSMGPMSSASLSIKPFLSAEGAYTWNQINSVKVNGSTAATEDRPWGGRFAVGFMLPYSELLRFSSELGGGYYGSTSVTVAHYGRTTISMDGYDLLFGALYKIKSFDLFGDVGVMVQNNRNNTWTNLAAANPAGLVTGSITNKSNQSQALPEIKVGGIYHLCDTWGISLAYMHVFGSDTGGNVTITPLGSLVSLNGTIETQNPTLDSIMLGVRYTLA